MKRVIACVDNGFNVLRTLTYSTDSWATFYHTSQQFYQNYFNMVTSNDGSIDMNEIKKTYEDAKRRFPDSDAFSMSADEHVEGKSSLISIFRLSVQWLNQNHAKVKALFEQITVKTIHKK